MNLLHNSCMPFLVKEIKFFIYYWVKPIPTLLYHAISICEK